MSKQLKRNLVDFYEIFKIIQPLFLIREIAKFMYQRIMLLSIVISL